MRYVRFVAASGCLAMLLHAAPAASQTFSGGGGSIYFGTGFPTSIDGASALADQLGFTRNVHNLLVGIQGFYQGNRSRLGGAVEAHAWGGVDNGAAGVVAAVGGLYGTRSFRHDHVLLNVGGIIGGGRARLGFGQEGGPTQYAQASVFYLEPLLSAGVAPSSWFGLEFQLSAPVFILNKDLDFTYGGNQYTATSRDMSGVSFAVMFTFGKIANP
jgi:hypothetical protein